MKHLLIAKGDIIIESNRKGVNQLQVGLQVQAKVDPSLSPNRNQDQSRSQNLS